MCPSFFLCMVNQTESINEASCKRFMKQHYMKEKAVFAFIERIKKETRLLLTDQEAYNIYLCLQATKKVKGDVAEVGVYKGGSAKLITEYKSSKTLHLFDTFDGLPNPGKIDEALYPGAFKATLIQVKNYLRQYKKILFYKGMFPKTAKDLKKTTFSFVHLDVDLYKSTKDALQFMYPKMSKGGMILIHDYICFKGVKKAVDEFFKDKPEPVLPLFSNTLDLETESQCLVVKT